MWLGILIGLVAATGVGIAAGMAWRRYPYAPVAAMSLVIAAYVALVASVAVWASRCEYCQAYFQGYDYSRRDDFRLALVWGGIAAGGIILITWLSAGLSILTARLVNRTLDHGPVRR